MADLGKRISDFSDYSSQILPAKNKSPPIFQPLLQSEQYAEHLRNKMISACTHLSTDIFKGSRTHKGKAD